MRTSLIDALQKSRHGWPKSRDARQVAVRVALGREHPLQIAHAGAQASVRLGLLDLAHVLSELAAVARDEAGAVIDLEPARVGEDARQTGPDRLRRNSALEDVLVIEDDTVGRGDVLAHRLVIGVDDDVREAALLDVGRDLIEILRLVAGARAREHNDAVAGRGGDHLREALALEEEAR